MGQLNISLLSTKTSQVLGYIMDKMLESKIPIHSVIFDSKIATDEDRIRWHERTNGLLPPVALHRFESEKIPFFFFSSHVSKTTVQYVKESKIDLLVNAGTPRILKEDIINAPKIGVLNCHPGLLPNFRGCTCVEWAIYLDEKVGNTVHLMTKEIDEGPIIIKEALTFNKSDKYHDIRTKVFKHGFELIASGIKKIIDSEYSLKCMEYEKKGRYYKVIDKDKMEEVLRKTNSGNYVYQK